jgi:PKD repeat protein
MARQVKYFLPRRTGPLSAVLFMALFVLVDFIAVPTLFAKSYTITASAGKGGNIIPSGKIRVEKDNDQSFTIVADEGYLIEDVKVDGKSQGPISSYTFVRVRANHKIEATFATRTFTITASAGSGGAIDPSGEVSRKTGENQSFAITPIDGFEIRDVLVDGASQGPLEKYTFSNILADHTIEAFFSQIFGVRNLTIPDRSMKIGDRVTATLEVDNDGGGTYTLVSGSVGGYPLTGLQRSSSTLYTATFTITEGGNSYLAGEPIPVSDLVLALGTSQGGVFQGSIIQDHDPVDAKFPVIQSMAVDAGVYRIGEVVNLSIKADGTGYSAGPATTVNGISLSASTVTFSETGSGNYLLTYVVKEGDPDVTPPENLLTASVVLIKPSGNTGEPFSTLSNASQVAIDAHPPRITRMEVPSIAVGPGGSVVVDVVADGTGYTAGPDTKINGIPLGSDRVSFTELSMGLYELTYQVSGEDPEAGPGELQVTVVLKDQAGNTGLPFSSLVENYLEIYTTRPEAVLAGPPEICEGEEAALTVMLSGRAPWDLSLDDGISITDYNNVTSSSLSIPVAPLETTTYRIVKVIDVNGVENDGSGDVQIRVSGITDVEIIGLALGYSVEDDPVKLEANVSGGIFTGPGVVSSTGYFYPDLAGIEGSPHEIVYSYENQGGCISRDTAQVYVVGSESALLMPAGSICENGEPFLITVLNVTGNEGVFRLLNSASAPVEGLQDHGDNTATIDPKILGPGDYTIEYQYFNGGDLYLRKNFTVGPVTIPLIWGLEEGAYCQDTPGIVLQSNLEGVRFEGPGVTWSALDGYLFNARLADPGEVTIACTYVSEGGCSATAEQAVQVLAAPEVQFGLSTACIPDGGEIVSFHNMTSERSSVKSWEWNFGDEGSGKKNLSNLEEPTHFYQEAGEKTITLTATTYDGCVVSHAIDSLIDSKPSAAFAMVSDCLPLGTGIQFINRSEMGSATVDTIIWRISTKEGILLDEIGSSTLEDTMIYPFQAADNYQVQLYTASIGGCDDEVTREISLKPAMRLAEGGYLEAFNQSNGDWSIHSEGQQESWTWDVPDFEGFIPQMDDRAWFTQLPETTMGTVEQSWIQSPCFDFSGMERPLIQMKIMRSFIPVQNGAVLQYLDVLEEGWKTVGDETPGINWYNSDNILQQPGGSYTGWGLEEFSPDRDWVTVVHDLDQVAGSPHVSFRVAFASHGKDAIGNQGVAVDDFQIRERSKLVVLEHFTDFSQDNSRLADRVIDSLGIHLPVDVIDLRYHMSYYGMDPLYEVNPDPSDTRSINYGVPEVPYTLLDGGVVPENRYDLSGLSLPSLEDRVRLLTLEAPVFGIDLHVDWGTEGLEAEATVTCKAGRFDDNIQLYLVVFETSVTTLSLKGTTVDSRNVVLDMLPTPAGILLGDSWTEGENLVRSATWTYGPNVEDIDELAVAALIQDRSSKRILQAVVQYKDPTVGLPGEISMPKALLIYPNPAGQFLYVRTGSEIRDEARVELTDLSGTKVLETRVPPGTEFVELEVGQLAEGMYILRWIETGQVGDTGKVIIAR